MNYAIWSKESLMFSRKNLINTRDFVIILNLISMIFYKNIFKSIWNEKNLNYKIAMRVSLEIYLSDFVERFFFTKWKICSIMLPELTHKYFNLFKSIIIPQKLIE